jgi:D-alanine-D-alanine ligase
MEEFNTVFKEKSIIVDCRFKGDIKLKDFLASEGSELEKMDISDSFSTKRIVVIGAGMSAEREVSFMSSNGVVNSLIELGYHVVFVDMGSDIAKVLNALKPHSIFNALHGTYGEDGCLPGLLNILRIPYTGPGVLASALAMNKKKSHEIFIANKIKVAHAITINKQDGIKSDPMPRPYVIKPLSQGSSVGIEIVFEEDEFLFSEYQFKYGDEILVEKYIKGREIQVAVLNGKAMGVMEIKLLKNKRFYDYETKYTEGFAEHLLPAPISEIDRTKVMQISEYACEIFDCMSGVIRVEFIYNEDEKEFYMLEVNTHPGMTPLSICPEIILAKGVNYTSLVNEILKGARFE